MTRASKKLFYKIGEVCEMCEIPAHVLRYWESEFSVLAPAKNRAGQRIYRQKDLDLIKTIRYLLYEEGYTIAGAEKKLREDGAGRDLPLFERTPRLNQKKYLSEIRKDLEGILELLKREK